MHELFSSLLVLKSEIVCVFVPFFYLNEIPDMCVGRIFLLLLTSILHSPQLPVTSDSSSLSHHISILFLSHNPICLSISPTSTYSLFLTAPSAYSSCKLFCKQTPTAALSARQFKESCYLLIIFASFLLPLPGFCSAGGWGGRLPVYFIQGLLLCLAMPTAESTR